EAVASAHGRDTIPDGLVFKTSITVEFGGNTLLDNADLWFHPNGGLVRMQAGDTTAVFDGSTAWTTGTAIPRPRFQLLTWPYFAVTAYKLDDGGTDLEAMNAAPLREGDDTKLRRSELTFESGVGDSPDDWYILYVNEADQLVAMSYIVTYGVDTEEAEGDPHAIVYDNFVNVPLPGGEESGAILSTEWTFYNWSREAGLVGDIIGKVSLTNLELVEQPEGAFDKPEGADEVLVPAAEAE
ncbi:MAG: hypothetical protein AAGK78_10670, partial [Planctomycetota bacterium]